MSIKKKLVLLLITFLPIFSLSSQNKDNSIFMDFRNQKISDIIYSLADLCEESVFIDETVTGNATFHFEDANFESALKRFSDYCQLYIENKNGVYKVSKVSIKQNGKDNISLNTESVMIEPFLNMLSRFTNTTIMYDNLPNANVTIRVENVKLEDILNLAIVKLPGFTIERIASGYYLTKSSGSASKRNLDVFTISKVENKYSISVQRASLLNIIETLFKKAEKEFSSLAKLSVQLEAINYSDKDFEDLLCLLLEQVNCDYTISNNIYYLFEIQKKDVLKNYKQTKIIHLKNISVDNLNSLIPAELNAGAFIRYDKISNSVILNGSSTEIKGLENFIAEIDIPFTDYYYKRFDTNNISAKDAISLLPKSLAKNEIHEIPGTQSFVTLVNQNTETAITSFLNTIDISKTNHEIILKYIKSEELLKNLPPSVTKENIVETANPNLLFFTGTEELYKIFLSELEKIDTPKQQIRYELLVIQRQREKQYNNGFSLSTNSTSNSSGYAWKGDFQNIFNINFDIISQFGIQFAGNLNFELAEKTSHVLADTTLNGISGETITFSNTSTSRYRDVIKDGNIYTSSTKEITSGLSLLINGWVSGEDMITVKVDAQVSKQGASNTSSAGNNQPDPPSTFEKKVSTNVRTKSGEPVIIGGLFQTDYDDSEHKVPGLSSVPVAGNLFKNQNKTLADSEFIIYLVPFVEKNNEQILSEEDNLQRLMNKYGNK